jgi:hypothetical protein
MLKSSSMFYGGLIVPAEKCDHDSYKTLGLVCPICHNAVYYVQNHTRTVKGKQSNVPAHFAHFEGDKEAIATCELRVSQITQEQEKKAENKAKNQRLKILRSRLWTILETSIRSQGLGTHDQELDQMFLAIYRNDTDLAKVIKDAVLRKSREILTADYFVSTTIESIPTGVDRWFELSKRYIGRYKQDEFLGWKNHILHQEMHQQIMSEVYLFLTTKMQTPIFNNLIEKGLYFFIIAAALCDYRELDELDYSPS